MKVRRKSKLTFESQRLNIAGATFRYVSKRGARTEKRVKREKRKRKWQELLSREEEDDDRGDLLCSTYDPATS